jgi:hypothetical protein
LRATKASSDADEKLVTILPNKFNKEGLPGSKAVKDLQELVVARHSQSIDRAGLILTIMQANNHRLHQTKTIAASSGAMARLLPRSNIL